MPAIVTPSGMSHNGTSNRRILTLDWMKGAWHIFHPCASYICHVDEIQEAIVVQLELTEEMLHSFDV